MKNRVHFGIRFKLILTLIFCFAVFIIIMFAGAFIIENAGKHNNSYYKNDISIMKQSAENVKELLIGSKPKKEVVIRDFKTYSVSNNLTDFIDSEAKAHHFDIIITDRSGRVLRQSYGNYEKQLDIEAIHKEIINYNKHIDWESNIYTVTPINNKFGGFIIVRGMVYKNEGVVILIALIALLGLFYIIITIKIKYFEELTNGLKEISDGNLKYRVKVIGKDEFALLAENMNSMAEKLSSSIEQERKVEQSKNELITNISHDLRTPLTSIIGYVKLVEERKQEGNQGKYIKIINDKAQRLKLLINDLFEYTKLSDRMVELNKTYVSMNELLRQVVEGIGPVFDENYLTVEYKAPEEEIYINVDVDKIIRVLENLLNNAVSYSEKPGIINVNLSKDGYKVIIEIKNSGKHIEKENLPKLFERLYRSDSSRASETGGSGLGLAIAKSIVQLHHGSICAESGGNTISFYLKL